MFKDGEQELIKWYKLNIDVSGADIPKPRI